MAEKIMTFNNAIQKFNIYRKLPLPATNECMTKNDVFTYLNTDPSSYTSYQNNQLVPESGFKNTKLTVGSGFNAMVRGITSYDYNLYIGGQFTTYNGYTANRIIKMSYTGQVDTSFISGSGFNGHVESIEVTSTGKLMVCGGFTVYRGVSANRIIRLNIDGTLDSSFNSGSGFNGVVRQMRVLSDNSIIAVGDFTSYNGTSCKYICKITSTGAVDTTFISNIGTGFNSIVAHINIFSPTEVLVGGYFKTFNGSTSRALIKLNTTGTVSTNYGTLINGPSNVQGVMATYVFPNGNILLGGRFTTYNGVSKNNLALISGQTLISSFNQGEGPNNAVTSIQRVGTNKFLISGDFTTYNGLNYNKLVFLNDDSTIDTTFAQGGGFNSFARSSEVQTDGKLLIGGDFTSYSGTPVNRLIRLNPNYSTDIL